MSWLDKYTYSSLESVCETFFPKINEEIDSDLLQFAMLKLCSRLQRCKSLLPSRLTKAQLRYLECSAVEEGVPELVFEIIRDKLLRDDSRKLRMLLFLMNTSLGNLIVTGFPTPFKVLITSRIGQKHQSFKIRYHSNLSEHESGSSRDSSR
jgi:hypothetical protein